MKKHTIGSTNAALTLHRKRYNSCPAPLQSGIFWDNDIDENFRKKEGAADVEAYDRKNKRRVYRRYR